MACELMGSRLVAFQLGALPPTENDAVETHLMACPACLREFWDVKRAVQDAARNEVRPDPAVRRDVRAAYAAAFPATGESFIKRGPWANRSRFGGARDKPWLVAGLAAAASVALAMGLWWSPRAVPRNREASRPAASSSSPVVDSASPTALSLHTL